MDSLFEGLADVFELVGDIITGTGELVCDIFATRDIADHPDYEPMQVPNSYESWSLIDPMLVIEPIDEWFVHWDKNQIRTATYNPNHSNVNLSSDELLKFYICLYKYIRYDINGGNFGKYESLYYAADAYSPSYATTKKIQSEMSKQIKDAGLDDRFLYVLSYTNEDGSLATLRDNKEVLNWCANRIMDMDTFIKSGGNVQQPRP